MKAALIEVVGGAPHLETLGDPSPTGDDQVLIKVEAAALNAIDLYIAAGHHRAGLPQLPYVSGIETVGTIIEGPDRGTRVRAAAKSRSA
ncbi:MAG: NADPH:quinone reductase, partial [Kribbellaceae bacterium]|nr:NADPH:quinone reductase [Kribbellaceae bacterium]